MKAKKNIKEISLPNCNLWLTGFGNDINGNAIVKLKFPNARGFSIQTNGVLKNTQYNLSRKKLSELETSEIIQIENEVVNYIKKYGSQMQKNKLKTYPGLKLPSYYSQPQKIGGYDVVWNKETFMHDILDNGKKVHSTKNDLQVRTWIKENGLKAAKSSSIKNRKSMKKSTKKPTAKQLAARAKFTKMAKSGELTKKRKAATRKKTRQTGSTHVAEDKLHKAKKPGKRISATGKTYYERRANRSDVGKLLAAKSNVFTTKAQAQKFAKEKNKTARTFRYVVALYPKSKGGDGKAHIVRKVRK